MSDEPDRSRGWDITAVVELELSQGNKWYPVGWRLSRTIPAFADFV